MLSVKKINGLASPNSLIGSYDCDVLYISGARSGFDHPSKLVGVFSHILVAPWCSQFLYCQREAKSSSGRHLAVICIIILHIQQIVPPLAAPGAAPPAGHTPSAAHGIDGVEVEEEVEGKDKSPEGRAHRVEHEDEIRDAGRGVEPVYDRARDNLGNDEGEGEGDAQEEEGGLSSPPAVVVAGLLVATCRRAQNHVGRHGEGDARGAGEDDRDVLEPKLVNESSVGAVLTIVQADDPAPRPR